MYPIINILKSKVKKYLPDIVYFFIYRLLIKARYHFSARTKEDAVRLEFSSFTSSLFKKVIVDGVSFEIKLDPNNGLVDKEIFSRGVWEPEMLKEIGAHIHPNSVCLDVGSNIGQHALYMASIVLSGKVYAFEPIKKLTDQIQESVSKNCITNIEICQFGLSNENESKDIYLNNLNMGNTTFKKRIGASSVARAETKIFDEFWGEKGKIDFLKLDVEGYEYYALLGMKKSLEKYHPTIIFEFSPVFYNKMNISSKDILNYLFSLGYAMYDLEDSKKEITKENSPKFIENTPTQTNILCLY